ncbi:unnamed protein product, partial [Urochloa humidicola]
SPQLHSPSSHPAPSRLLRLHLVLLATALTPLLPFPARPPMRAPHPSRVRHADCHSLHASLHPQPQIHHLRPLADPPAVPACSARGGPTTASTTAAELLPSAGRARFTGIGLEEVLRRAGIEGGRLPSGRSLEGWVLGRKFVR